MEEGRGGRGQVTNKHCRWRRAPPLDARRCACWLRALLGPLFLFFSLAVGIPLSDPDDVRARWLQWDGTGQMGLAEERMDVEEGDNAQDLTGKRRKKEKKVLLSCQGCPSCPRYGPFPFPCPPPSSKGGELMARQATRARERREEVYTHAHSHTPQRGNEEQGSCWA